MDNRRAGLWLLFLGGAAVVALIPEFFMQHEEEIVQPASRGSGPVGASQAVQPVADAGPSLAPASAMPEEGSGLFAAHSWTVAPPPQPEPAWTPPPAPVEAPPAPMAPALPFEFIGKMDDAESLRVFLTRGEKIYTVTVGDVIDGTYRVERVGDSEMVLTYLPLNVTQTLSVGGKL